MNTSKRFALVILFAMAAITVNTFAAAETVIPGHQTDEGQIGMYTYVSATKECYDSGVNCMPDALHTSSSGTIEPAPGGYVMNLHLDAVSVQVKDAFGSWNQQSRGTTDYFHFTPKDQIRINQCTAYPALVGMTLSLSGIVTDGSGNYTVFVPAP